MDDLKLHDELVNLVERIGIELDQQSHGLGMVTLWAAKMLGGDIATPQKLSSILLGKEESLAAMEGIIERLQAKLKWYEEVERNLPKVHLTVTADGNHLVGSGRDWTIRVDVLEYNKSRAVVMLGHEKIADVVVNPTDDEISISDEVQAVTSALLWSAMRARAMKERSDLTPGDDTDSETSTPSTTSRR